MADKPNKSITNHKLQFSTNLTIGGKTFNSQDVSRLTPQSKEVHTVTGNENVPRNINKEFVNEAGSIKTGNALHTTTAGGVSPSPVVTSPSIAPSSHVATEIHSNSPVSTPFSERAHIPTSHSHNIMTSTEREGMARDNVESYTKFYQSTNVHKASDTSILHGGKVVPQTTGVEGIKTGVISNPATSPISKSPQITTPSPSPVSVSQPSRSGDDTEQRKTPSVIAGSIPKTNSAVSGVAYFTAVGIGNYDSKKVRVTGDKVLTGSAAEKAALARAVQSSMNASYQPNIIQKTVIQSKIAFFSELSKYQNKPVNLFQSASTGLLHGSRDALGKAQSALSKSDDMGTQAAGHVIGAGFTGYSVVKTAQNATPILVGAIKNTPSKLVNVGKGAWDVSSTFGKATVTVAKTAGYIQTGVIPMNSQALSMLKLQSQMTGLNTTNLSRKIIHRVETIKNRITTIKTGVITASNVVKRGVSTSYSVVRGLVTGKTTAAVAAAALERARNATIQGIKTGAVRGVKTLGKGTIRATVKGGMWTWHKGIPKGFHIAGGAALGLGKVLASTDNTALQGVGGALTVTRHGVKTALVGGKITYRTLMTSTKVTIKTAKNTWYAASYIKNKGLRNAFHHGKRKATKAVYEAGKSAVTAVINFVRTAGMKVVLPLLLIAAIVLGGSNVITAPVSAIAALFGGTFSTTEDGTTYTDYDIREFLSNTSYGIPALREAYINSMVSEFQSNLETNGGRFDYVRFYTSEDSKSQIDCTYAGVNSVFYTSEQIENIVQPIFNAALVMDYDLAPTDAEAKALMQDIFNSIFKKTYAETVEWCGQDEDGTTHPCDSCGRVHAASDCTDHITGTHGGYTCDSCCYYWCPGHHHSSRNSDGTTDHWTSYCSPGCRTGCTGYDYCGSHDVLSITLNMDGVYGLLQKYFTDPIDQLANLASRTEEQEVRLQTLKDYYELCLEYINEVNVNYGGGLSMDDLSGVAWVNGTRTGNQALIDLAMSQAGQTGGQPYWSWYGFSSRVEWCATFVSWCLNQSGYSAPKFASCQYQGVPYFTSHGQWAAGGYTNLVAGDVIFFDWEGDGRANHVGLVIGTDGTNVYTVEGNSGDTCKVKSYSINSSVILGYGLMNY